MAWSTSRFQNYEDHLDRAVESGTISRHNADLITRFVLDYTTEKEINGCSVLNLVSYLETLVRLVPDLENFSYSDIQRVRVIAREKYKKNTQHKLIIDMKLFCSWLIQEGISKNLDIKKINNIELPKRELVSKREHEILTREEVSRLVNACNTLKARALLATIYDCGLRGIEAGTLQWGDVVFDADGCVVTVDGKTGKERRIRMMEYSYYLSEWKAHYPGAIKPDTRVFVNSRGDTSTLSYQAAKKMLAKAAKMAGIEKHVHLHILRHSRITHWLEMGVPEYRVKKMAWGTTNTPMIAVYEHTSDDAMDDEFRKVHGISPRKKRDDPNAARVCNSCQYINPPGMSYCGKCRAPLTKMAKEQALHDVSSAKSMFDSMSAEEQYLVMQKMRDEIKSEILNELTGKKK
jgi:site-specific recombinase XerD